MQKADSIGRWLLVSLAMLDGGSCRHDSGQDAIGAEAARIELWATDGDAQVVERPPMEHGRSSARVRWTIETASTWEAYAVVLKETPPRGYAGCETESGHRLTCKRALSGDAFLVEVGLVSAGPPLRISVSLLSYAF